MRVDLRGLRAPAYSGPRHERATILPHSSEPGSGAPRAGLHASADPRALAWRFALSRLNAPVKTMRVDCVTNLRYRDRAQSVVQCLWMRFTTVYIVIPIYSFGFVYWWWVGCLPTTSVTTSVDACAFTIRPLSFHIHSSNSAPSPIPRFGRWPCVRAPFLLLPHHCLPHIAEAATYFYATPNARYSRNDRLLLQKQLIDLLTET